MVVEEGGGSTSSGSTNHKIPGEIQCIKTAAFYQWKYSYYFVVVEEGVKNTQARCTLCAPSNKPLSVDKTVALVLVIPEGKRA